MFTGIVEATGRVRAVQPAAGGQGLRLQLDAAELEGLEVGESVSVSGCCLTVADLAPGGFAADVVPETLRRTKLGAVVPGSAVNLERAMTATGRLGGHIVQGHVDGVARLLERRPVGTGAELRFELDSELARYLVVKGSVAVDGVSLTVAAVADPASPDPWFEVALVPHTLAVTTLGSLQPGDRAHLEVDIVAKHVERLLAFAATADGTAPEAATASAGSWR